jgi:AraC family ethanolamine operon transcriptional activator
MMALLEVLKVETPQPATTQSYKHRKKVVDCARQFLDHHLDEPVTVTQLCKITNVSRRTLQYSFDSILGISPIQYLRISRLNGVRRALVKADKSQSVSDIAAQWGFWHLSQFAQDYKQLFGESPSKTLAGLNG